MKNIDCLYQCHVCGQNSDIWQLQCHLRIIYQQFGQQIVIVSPQNCEIGWFIESKTTKLATQIVHEFQLNPKSLVWIERDPHYASRSISTEYSEVRFEWHQAIAFNPQWHPISQEDLEFMIGNQWLTGSLENQLAQTKEKFLRKIANV